MCVTKLLLTSECRTEKSSVQSLVSGNTEWSLYRVLRVVPRGTGRSVDRECAGRNAESVKGSSPERQFFPWWPSKYQVAKAVSKVPRAQTYRAAAHVKPWSQRRPFDTTGVQALGMYTRPATERERSATGRAIAARSRLRASGQGLKAKSKATPEAEVRCARSSEARAIESRAKEVG